ncbi:unnamed protein product [Cyprideis torosa]|uniref:Large ribosomal subunit protein mL44 n=1 Tax=Cyprideis torosa TaxID=163714 RepID=A0A7R8WAX2_9CRUS|nr:unnamed protein product [Cyprideis torosa]CAG0888825.1 unnamed protein product [Cyprideis torosa]
MRTVRLLALSFSTCQRRAAASFPSVPPSRHFSRSVCCKGWIAQYKSKWYREVTERSRQMYPQPEPRRSSFVDWNYGAELYAFGKRLGEEFDSDLLREALRFESYVVKAIQEEKQLGLTDFEDFSSDGNDSNEVLRSNRSLIKDGRDFMEAFIPTYIRGDLVHLPEEGVRALSEHLLSPNVLCHVAKHLGLKDLILSNNYPPTDDEFAETFCAVIGCLLKSPAGGVHRARTFVRDFLLTQLMAKDLLEIWNPFNPMGILVGILSGQSRPLPESRICFSTAINTLESSYVVGIYSDRMMIGKGPGRTTEEAELMAAYDALRRIFHIDPKRIVFPDCRKEISKESLKQEPNPSVAELSDVRKRVSNEVQ